MLRPHTIGSQSTPTPRLTQPSRSTTNSNDRSDLCGGEECRRGTQYPYRILRTPSLAGKQVSRQRGQFGRRAGHCAIHASNCGRSGAEEPFRSPAGDLLHPQNFYASFTTSSEIWAWLRPPTMRAAAGLKNGFHAGIRYQRKRAITSRSSPATKPKPGLMRRIPSICRPICQTKRRARASVACQGRIRSRKSLSI